MRLWKTFHRRKNFLFAGSHDAAYRTATLYSVMRTRAQHGVPPLPYLTDVLRKLAAGGPTAGSRNCCSINGTGCTVNHSLARAEHRHTRSHAR